MARDLRLYAIPGSHVCLVAELMLRHKGLAYRTVMLPPVVHAPTLRLLGFPDRTAPALRIGRDRVQGSRRISRALDALQPDPPLFPRDPDRRHAVEEAERRGEEIQDAVRRIFYAGARRRPSAAADLLGAQLGPLRAAAMRAAMPAFVRIAAAAHGASDEACRRDLAALPDMLDQVDRWIADGTLGGEALNAADFQIGACLRPLLLCDDLAPLGRNRPWAEHSRRVAPHYPGHLPPLLPTDWLPPMPTDEPQERSRAEA